MLGGDAIVGGLTWERSVVDPLPGPRKLSEVEGAEPLNEAVALCNPETIGPGACRRRTAAHPPQGRNPGA